MHIERVAVTTHDEGDHEMTDPYGYSPDYTKTCRSCWATKPGTDFGRKSDQPDGISIYCLECARAKRAALNATKPRNTRIGKSKASFTARAPGATTSASSDYQPPRDVLATWSAIQQIAANGKLPPNMLFIGPSGSGKTSCAKDLARRAGLAFTQVDASAMTDPEVWFGTREVVVEDGAPKTMFHESEFVRALRQPGVLLIDEVNRTPDSVRNILLPLLDDSRRVTNPLTGEVVVRDPMCFVIMTGNVGLAFTGTYAVDIAFTTRAHTSKFDYLAAPEETALAISRTGCTPEDADLFVRFATETRTRHRADPDFEPVSTRVVLAALELVAVGLDATTAIRQAAINSASDEGGADSYAAALEMIWTGIRPTGN